MDQEFGRVDHEVAGVNVDSARVNLAAADENLGVQGGVRPGPSLLSFWVAEKREDCLYREGATDMCLRLNGLRRNPKSEDPTRSLPTTKRENVAFWRRQ